jgi:predicted transcriptional regulator
MEEEYGAPLGLGCFLLFLPRLTLRLRSGQAQWANYRRAPALWSERPEINLPRRNRFDRAMARAYTGAMEIELSPELQAKLERIASQQGRDSKSLVHEAVERLVDYDEWFLRQVEIGLAQVDRGELLEDSEVAARMENLISRKRRQD